VKVVAISKTKPVDVVKSAYNQGHRAFGENKVQELREKADQLPGDIEWHMVGHLQSNKVKYIAPDISMIQSVDSGKILKVINKEAQKNDRVIDCLLQVRIAEEESKFGFTKGTLNELLDSGITENYSNIRMRGVMGMATFTDDMEKIAGEFRFLRSYFEELKRDYFSGVDYFTEVSMGMTNDYKVAIDEGATIIRVGTLIFGAREK